MSGLKNNFRVISIAVNDLLTRYITIHDEVFKFSLRKIIPLPFVFKAIDFQSLRQEAGNVLAQLKDCKIAINKMISSYSSSGKEYLEVLSKYIIALIETVDLLEIVLGELYEKSKNSNQYNYSQYKKDLALYENAVQNYVNLGKKLNEMYQKVK